MELNNKMYMKIHNCLTLKSGFSFIYIYILHIQPTIVCIYICIYTTVHREYMLYTYIVYIEYSIEYI